MSEEDFVSAALHAISQGDLTEILADTTANGELIKAIGESIDFLTKSGLPKVFILSALSAGIAFARPIVQGEKDGTTPPEVEDFLKLMASAPVAPEAFKALRKSLGVSQATVGKLCGVTHTAVSLWERGLEPMPIQAIEALIKLAGKDIITSAPPEMIVSGADLRELRKKLGMRQRDLANALGVSLPAIEKWEAFGPRPLVPATVKRIGPKLEELRAQAA